MSDTKTHTDPDDLVQQIAIAIAPIIEDYIDEKLPDPDSGDIDLDKLATLVAERIGDTEIDIDELADLVTDRITQIDIDDLADAVAERIDTADTSDLGTLVDRANTELDALQFPGRHVGPREPDGSYHTPDVWGIHFKTDRAAHIQSAIINGNETGTFTAELAEYDGEDQYDVVDSAEIEVEEAEVDLRVTLDLDIPDEGEYLLTREGGFPLRRTEFNGWDEYFVDGLKLIGGSKAGDYDDNDYWYYFFDISIAATEDHHIREE